MTGTSEGLQEHDHSDVEINTAGGAEDVLQASVAGLHEGVEELRISVEIDAERVRHGQDDVAVSDAGKEPPPDEVGPLVRVEFGTGEAKARLAGESDASGFPASDAAILHESRFFGIAAIEHLLDDGVVIGGVKTRVKSFEGFPMISEDLLESVFVDPLGACPLLGSRRCQGKGSPPERVPMPWDGRLHWVRVHGALHELSSRRTAYSDRTTKSAGTR